MKSDGDDVSASRQAEVLRLYHLDELSIRAIGRRLQMSRKTVRQMLGNVARERRAIDPENRSSLLDPHESFLRAELKACPELKAPAMLERLRQRGFTGGITIVRERLRLLRPTPMSEAFLTQHFVPGQIAMVDWADFGFALRACWPSGSLRRPARTSRPRSRRRPGTPGRAPTRRPRRTSLGP